MIVDFPPFSLGNEACSSLLKSLSLSVERELLLRSVLSLPSFRASSNAKDDAEDTVEAGEDLLDEFGRIMVNVAEHVVFVVTFTPPN